MEKELFSRSKPVNAFSLTTVSTAAETLGAEIDTFGFNSVLIALKLVITTGKITAVKVYASDASASYSTAETTTTLFNPDQLPVTASAILNIGSVAKKRYIKVGITSVDNGGSTNYTVDGIAILSDSKTVPLNTVSMFEAATDINAPGALADCATTPPKAGTGA